MPQKPPCASPERREWLRFPCLRLLRIRLSPSSLFLPFFALHSFQVLVEPIKSFVPETSIALHPFIHLADGPNRKPARSPLSLAAARDESRLLQDVQMLCECR